MIFTVLELWLLPLQWVLLFYMTFQAWKMVFQKFHDFPWPGGTLYPAPTEEALSDDAVWRLSCASASICRHRSVVYVASDSMFYPLSMCALQIVFFSLWCFFFKLMRFLTFIRETRKSIPKRWRCRTPWQFWIANDRS